MTEAIALCSVGDVPIDHKKVGRHRSRPIEPATTRFYQEPLAV